MSTPAAARTSATASQSRSPHSTRPSASSSIWASRSACSRRSRPAGPPPRRGRSASGCGSMRNKVVRYPGHVVVWKGFMDAGLFSEQPIRVGDQQVVPRQLFHALIEPQIRADDSVDDIVIAHVIVTGRKAGRATRAIVDMRVVRDRKLGFSAMEETTGWHAAIVAHLMARGRIAVGAAPVELATDSAEIVAELRARDFRSPSRSKRSNRTRRRSTPKRSNRTGRTRRSSSPRPARAAATRPATASGVPAATRQWRNDVTSDLSIAQSDSPAPAGAAPGRPGRGRPGRARNRFGRRYAGPRGPRDRPGTCRRAPATRARAAAARRRRP